MDDSTPARDSGANPDDTAPPDDTAGPDDTAPPDDTDDTAPPDDTGDTGPVDADGDGVTDELDCDDADASVYPGAEEVCGDGVVNDCDGSEDAASAACEAVATADDALASWQIPASEYDPTRLAGVGDVNGDGFDDLAFGWPSMDPWESSRSGLSYALGGVFLFLGPVSGGYVQGDEDIFFRGVEDRDAIGWDLVGMGDVDGDGYDDIAVGAAGDFGYIGSATPAVYRVDGPADIGTIDEATVLVQAPDAHEWLGASLLTVPDQDGDGAPDLLVGARCVGEAHLLSGAGEELVAGDDDIATFTGPSGESRFGHAFAVGDLDGDGVMDVAIAAPESQMSAGRWGFVSVFSGSLSGDYASGSADVTIQALSSDTDGSAVCLGSDVGIGDLNDDGTDDLVIGAPFRSLTSIVSGEGSAFVYMGPLSTDRGIPDADVSILGELNRQKLGGELDAGHDLDGDGQDDLLLGNGYVDVNGTDYSVSGSSYPRAWLFTGPLTSGTLLASDANLTWQVDSDMFGTQARVAGDTDGDGELEVLLGRFSDELYLFDLTAGGY